MDKTAYEVRHAAVVKSSDLGLLRTARYPTKPIESFSDASAKDLDRSLPRPDIHPIAPTAPLTQRHQTRCQRSGSSFEIPSTPMRDLLLRPPQITPPKPIQPLPCAPIDPPPLHPQRARLPLRALNLLRQRRGPRINRLQLLQMTIQHPHNLRERVASRSGVRVRFGEFRGGGVDFVNHGGEVVRHFRQAGGAGFCCFVSVAIVSVGSDQGGGGGDDVRPFALAVHAACTLGAADVVLFDHLVDPHLVAL